MRSLLLLALFMTTSVSQAQTVEYEIPTTYDLVPGRLSVAFADSVSEAHARAAVMEAGYTVVEAHFLPLRISAAQEVDGAESALRQHPAVIEVQRDAPLPDHAVVVWVSFRRNTSEGEAVALIESIDAFQIIDVARSKQDLTVAVPVGDEEAAVTTLEAIPGVRYVSYVNAE